MLDNHFVPDGYGILPYINVYGKEVSTYSLFVGFGLLLGVLWFYFSVTRKEKKNQENKLSKINAYFIVLSALIFGIFGS